MPTPDLTLYAPQELRTARRTLSRRLAYPLVASLIGLALYASGTPSPIYGIYQHLWGFSPSVLTVIYAAYALGVLTTLLLAGRISDDVGRRPVILAALSTIAVTTVAFMLARSVVWLLVARAIQGIATGALVSASSAAMLDLHPRRDAADVGRFNGVVSNWGIGLGVLVASALVQLASAPRVLPYAVLLGLILIMLVAVYLMPEPVVDRKRLRLSVERPSVPAEIRRPFLLAALAVIAVWSIGGLLLSLGPELSADLLNTNNILLSALPIFVLTAAGAFSQILFGHIAAWRAASAGSLALAVGVLTIVAAAAADSPVLLFTGAVIGGIGFGLAFMGGLRHLSAVIPPEHRAAVMSAFYVVAYVALSIPAVLAGILDTPLGLRTTFELFGSIVAVVALAVAFEAWRARTRAPAVA